MAGAYSLNCVPLYIEVWDDDCMYWQILGDYLMLENNGILHIGDRIFVSSCVAFAYELNVDSATRDGITRDGGTCDATTIWVGVYMCRKAKSERKELNSYNNRLWKLRHHISTTFCVGVYIRRNGTLPFVD